MLCSGFLSPAGPELGCFEDGRRPLIPEVYPQSWLSIVTVLEMNYMTKIVNRTFVLNPLAAALAAVLVAPAALAAPFIPTTPGTNQLPGEGKVVVGGAGATGLVFTPTAATNPTVVAGVPAVAGQSVNGINLVDPITIVTWGGAGANINSKNGPVAGGAAQPGGFNIGSAAQFYMVNTKAAQAAVLNVDISNATSVIAGKLTGAITAGANPYPTIFLANANGIIVNGSAVITTGPVSAADAKAAGTTVAGGLGLLGLDMSGTAAQTAFQTASPADATVGTGGLLNLDFANAAPVRIDTGASITGGAGSATGVTATAPSKNAPNPTLGGTAFLLLAGADSGSTNGVSNAGTITTNQLAVSAGNAYNNAGFGAQGYFYMAADNAFVDIPASATTFANFNAGATPLTPTTATNAFASAPGSFVNSGTINDLGAWATKTPLAAPAGGTSRAYINANGNASNSGLIATGSAVISSPLQFWATGVTNTGTLQGNSLLINFGVNGVNLGGTVTQFSGALSALNRVSNILIAPQVISGVTQQGAVAITAPITVYSDTNTDGVLNAYNVTGNSITLSAAQKVTSLPGNPVTNANGAVLNSSVRNGAITVGNTGSLTAGNVRVGAPAAAVAGQFVAAANAANLPALVLNGAITTTANAANTTIADPNLLVLGVNNSGFGTAAGTTTFLFNGTSLTGPGSITTTSADLYARGDVRNPVSANDFLQNGLNITASQVGISAINTQQQAINLKLTGASTVFSGVTITPFANAVLTSGTYQAGLPVPNAGSSLIVQGTGNLTVAGSFQSLAQGLGGADALANPFNAAFYFPGGVVFKSATQVQAGNVMNAWSTAGTVFQGVYFEAPLISSGWVAMNANQFANYSTNPGTPPITYYLSLGNNGATVNFIPGSHAYRSDDPAASCGAGTGCTSTYSTILAAAIANPATWKGIVNVHPFN